MALCLQNYFAEGHSFGWVRTMADILLVDDDGNVLLTLAIALRRRGHNVTMASDGQRALEQLRKKNFQFLVTDVRMPGMNGFDLARQANHLPQPPRVILTSAYSNIGTHDGLAEAFLQKPVDITQLDDLLKGPPPNSTRDNPPEGRAHWRPVFSTGH
jgi:CheY-like chemotaxis protein